MAMEKNKPMSIEAIRKSAAKLAERRLQYSSVAAFLTQMVKAGNAVRISPGMYKLI